MSVLDKAKTRDLQLAQLEAKARLGDLIQVKRTLYRHFAVYIGGGRIIHFST